MDLKSFYHSFVPPRREVLTPEDYFRQSSEIMIVIMRNVYYRRFFLMSIISLTINDRRMIYGLYRDS